VIERQVIVMATLSNLVLVNTVFFKIILNDLGSKKFQGSCENKNVY